MTQQQAEGQQVEDRQVEGQRVSAPAAREELLLLLELDAALEASREAGAPRPATTAPAHRTPGAPRHARR
ncbi:hypothetical protein [uncultured Pseudokineococcus sp.]|uniref:hypothetical protein n=1 Tax=uncultured Pseudokineococcus sp. TaxID=1642928 RepID=UPI00262BCBD6|nr:hypothetical protein [uncultured Pseudokineococcus sp.]